MFGNTGLKKSDIWESFDVDVVRRSGPKHQQMSLLFINIRVISKFDCKYWWNKLSYVLISIRSSADLTVQVLQLSVFGWLNGGWSSSWWTEKDMGSCMGRCLLCTDKDHNFFNSQDFTNLIEEVNIWQITWNLSLTNRMFGIDLIWLKFLQNSSSCEDNKR